MILIVFKLINQNKLKVTFTKKDLQDLNITYDDINYDNDITKKIMVNILSKAKIATGFDTNNKLLLIEVFPDNDDGCIIYFSLLQDTDRKNNSYNQDEKNVIKPNNAVLGSCSFQFDNIETLINSCIRLFKIYGFRIHKSSLYKMNTHYILSITTIDINDYKLIKMLKEYASLRSIDSLYQSFLDEHGILIIKDNAIDLIYKYFK